MDPETLERSEDSDCARLAARRARLAKRARSAARQARSQRGALRTPGAVRLARAALLWT